MKRTGRLYGKPFNFIAMPGARHHFSICILLLLLFLKGAAQADAGYELLSTAQGLSQGMVNDMIQDKEGFIWIATKGGLNRYDGYSFKVFTTDPQDTTSISSNAVSNLLEDSKGRIWVGTYDGGVNVYNKQTGRFLRIVQRQGDLNGLSGNRIESSIIELPDGRIAVAPDGGIINIISLPMGPSAVPVVSSITLPEGKKIVGFSKDDKGFIWFGCRDHSIYILSASLHIDLLSDGKTFTPLIEAVGKKLSSRSSQVSFLSPMPDAGIELIDSTAQMHKNILSYDANGTLVINKMYLLKPGAAGKNFYDFSGLKAGDNINNGESLVLETNVYDQTLKCLLLDRSGILWIGTLGHGIYKYRISNNRFQPLFPKWSIQRIKLLANELLYVHGWDMAQVITASGNRYPHPLIPLVFNSPFTNVLQAKNGDYWIGNQERKIVLCYTAALQLKMKLTNPVDESPTEQLPPMLEDSKHTIWICGANGTLARVDPSSGSIQKFVIDVQQKTRAPSLAQTNAFYEDSKGTFWLGTEHGFARLRFTDYTNVPEVKWYKNIPGDNRSLSYNYVSWFMDDPVNPDYLWIATKGGGLNRMDKTTGSFIHYTTKNGLPNDVVYGAMTDNAGNIWGSTNKGLFCMLATNGKSAIPVFRVFSTSDGLQADEFNSNAFAKLSNGNLVFGGVNGLNIFDPAKVLAHSFSPAVLITGMQIGNKVLKPGDETGILKTTIEQTQSVTLTHLQDVITLEFSSLDFTAPLQNKYRYQLVGIDKEWIESGTRRSVTYLHLPAGTYVFKVQGSNSQGIWSNSVAELQIKILPPWWRSGWSYSIYAILVILAVWLFLRFKVRKAKLQSQLHFQQEEAKRVKELDAVKTQLFTNITHEFRTPLTVILGMAQQVVEKPNEQFDSRMDMIMRNGRNLLNLVNQLLDLSKLETGKMQLQLSQADVIHFLRYMVESFHSLADSQYKQMHFLTELDALYIEFDREKLRQIVSNLLSNAIKFTPEKGNIYITVAAIDVVKDGEENVIVTIKVKDTGTGIAEDKLPYIFDRFYQSDDSHTRHAEGTGIGLALTKELVKLMDGEITAKSPASGALKGTEMTVTIPFKKSSAIVHEIPEPAIADNVVAEKLKPEIQKLLINDNAEITSSALLLLVEDNADVVAYTASCLPDYRLVVGKDGREGLDIATEMIPDLVITDVMMPYMDGFEMVDQLRQNETTSHIPVIMLTAKADMKSRIEGLQKGADAYLEKPFHKEELLIRIQKLLEMRKSLQQYYLRQAGLQEALTEEEQLVPQEVKEHPKEDEFVKRVREVIEENLTDINFSVEKLCKMVFMSHSQLHRKLDALTGFSPNKFIRMLRMKKAKALLMEPANSIASIALDCGYNDPGYFARIFKQEYGLAPQEWRVKQGE